MKKIFIAVLAAAAMVLGTNANAQLSVGAGFSLNQIKAKADGASVKINPAGVYVGVDYSIPFAGNFAVTPGVYYTYGATDKATTKAGGTVTTDGLDIKGHTVSVPVYVSFNHEFGFGKGFIYAGPAAQYCIDLKTKGSSFYDKTDDFSHFSLAIGLGLGCTFAEHYRLSAGYNFGVTNIYTGSDEGTLHNNVLTVGFNYIF